jgi:hypothetical protein
VVLVPETRLRIHSRLFDETTVGADGHFSIRGIAPGDYLLFAWDPLDVPPYRDPEALAPYEADGQAVHIAEGGSVQVELKAIQKR